jgi:hypothetical protein
MFEHVHLRRSTAAGLGALSALAGLTVATTGPAAATAWKAGYVWADRPTAANYVPNPTYQWNGKGGINRVHRLGTGRYEVSFARLAATPAAGTPGSGGTAQVAAYGTSARTCKAETWFASGTAEVVRVRCTTPISGALVDSTFTASFTNGKGVANHFAFAKADRPTAVSYTPASPFQFDDRGGTITVTRSGTGRYKVKLPHLGEFSGDVAVTAVGTDADACNVLSWGPAGAQFVNVACTNADGLAADSAFAVTYTSLMNVIGVNTAHGGYLWSNHATAPPAYQSNNDGSGNRSDNSVSSIGTGQYVAHIAHINSTANGGYASTTAYGSSDPRCVIDHWQPSGDGTDVYVDCFKAEGLAGDFDFTVQFVVGG